MLWLNTYVFISTTFFCGAFEVRDISFSRYLGGTFFQKEILFRFGSDYGSIVHFVWSVFLSCWFWFWDMNRQSWLSTRFVLCSSSLFNDSLIEANSGQNWSMQLKKKTYLNYENYCHDFIEGIRSLCAIAGTWTPNSPYFRNKTSLVLLMCHHGVEKPLVFHYLSFFM